MAIGCAENYSALIVRQAGDATGQGATPVAVGEISEITNLQFNRTLSGTSNARIVFTKCPTNCGFMSTPVKPWAYELWIYRDNLLAWCGPIVTTTESRIAETFEITAWDITGWTTRRRIDEFYSITNNPTSIAVNILQTFFDGSTGRHDPGFLPYIHFLGFAAATISVEYDEYQYQVGQKWVDLVRAGFNYTTVGRYTFVWGETAPNIDLPYVIDATSILGEMELVQDGTDFATRVAGIGEGIISSQGPFGAEAAYYGDVDWPTAKYSGLEDFSQLNTLVVNLFNEKRDMSPTLVIPSGSSLASNTDIQPTGYNITFATPVALPDLICGMRYDVQVAAEQFCQPGRYPMRLNEVKVTWTPRDQEKIAVGFDTLGIPAVEE